MIYKDSFKILLLILISSTILTSCFKGYIVPSKQLKYAKQFAPFDAIIVPGIPFNEELAWDQIMQTRVRWSVYLYNEGLAKNIIYSGSNVYSPFFESEIMRLYALEMGIPDSVIFTEKEAKHGVENLYYSFIMAKEMGLENIALATDPAQISQIGAYGRPFANLVKFLPADMSLVPDLNVNSINIDPSSAYEENFSNYGDEPIIKRLIRSSGGAGLKKKMNKYLRNAYKK